MEMSSVSLSGGVSATLFSSLQKSQATDRTQQLFGKLDINGDGAIDTSELKTFADDISSKTGTEVDASSLMTSLDSDGNGSVSSTELKDNGKALFDQLRQQLMGSQLQATSRPPDADKIFRSMDTDGDGSITKSELDSFLSQRTDGSGNGPHGPPPARSQGSSSTGDSSEIISKLVASLIAQYGASKTDAATSGSTLSVAA
jgi:Ca2+-binding EF-hand superfamily protein